jgi:hypothetical protein
VACLLGAAGLIAAGALGSTYEALVAIAIATIGIYDSKPSFWPMPGKFLTGTATAAGIALVNCIGNLGGFVGPYAGDKGLDRLSMVLLPISPARVLPIRSLCCRPRV